MKLENFKQAEGLVAQIKKHERMLNDLNNAGDDLHILITDQSMNNKFYIIKIKSEHEYANFGKELIDKIKFDLQTRIDNLKSMLEQL